jgi:CDP-diacylglycerol--serine O-phosphatidyltransferase
MRWIRKVSAADYLTLANGLLGFLAITYIIDGRFNMAYLLLMTAILIDGIDGRLARLMKSKHNFGRYIDSFSDSISFCFAPAVLVYSTFYDPSKGSAFASLDNAAAVAVPTVFVLFGIMRLARFAHGGYKERNFLGMPTPAAAFLVISLCILFGDAALISNTGVAVLPPMLMASILMISDLPYPKIGGGLFIPAALAMFIGILSTGLLVFGAFPSVTLVLTIISFLFILIYMTGGPLYVKISDRDYITPERV